jgi:hypothetical protein
MHEISSITHALEKAEFALGTALEKQCPDYRHLDWKITPQLQPSEPCGSEDIFQWKFDWEIELGLADGRILKKSQVSLETKELIDEYAQRLGWFFVEASKKSHPIPWNNSTISASFYNGHKSWVFYGLDSSLYPVKATSFEIGQGFTRRIIGVMQVRDAELVIEKTILNVLPMLDWLIVLEHGSIDSTPQIIQQLVIDHPRILAHPILCVEAGGRYLHSLCGTDTVVVRVDADEVWDPAFSKKMRKYLLDYEFKNEAGLRIVDGFLHVSQIDLKTQQCHGKLMDWKGAHYFGNILAWPQLSERLHGDRKLLRAGVKNEMHRAIFDSDNFLPVLHFPFVRLSDQPSLASKPGWEKYKLSYIEKNPLRWMPVSLTAFDLQLALCNILEGETSWCIPEKYWEDKTSLGEPNIKGEKTK